MGEDSPVAVFDSVICKDGELSVKFRIDPKAPGGVAGIVWRYQDEKNYYLLDFDSTRKMISLFRVKDGVRRPIPDRTGRPKAVRQVPEIGARRHERPPRVDGMDREVIRRRPGFDPQAL